MAPPTESAVALKLPPFWAAQPRAWFTQAEAQFTLRGITQDETMYFYLVAALDQHTAERLLDVLESPPAADKYKSLKARLLGTYSLTRQQRASRLLSMSGLGDRRPSELMDEMLALLGDPPPCLLFEELFRQQLPADVRMAIVSADFTDPRAVAQLADQLWASRPQPVATATQQSDVKEVLDATQPAVAAAGTSRPASQGRQPSRRTDAGFCFFHRRFGAKARRCQPPCSFQGNGQAGRQ
jgi:hypothetical protein